MPQWMNFMEKAYNGLYKDIEAVILENDFLRVSILPRWGSKIASIYSLKRNYELLWQNPNKNFVRTEYGADFSDGDCSGFDEMFPSISRCYYEDGPWAGTEIPDHGEVWTIPWTETSDKGTCRMSVQGVRFPYVLQKEVSLEGPDLVIRYTLENPTRFPFYSIWAAHPLFNTCPGMEIIVPSSLKRIINAVPGKVLGSYGKVHSFPKTPGPSGREIDLRIIPEKSDRYQKYYFSGPLQEGWCSLYHPDRDLTVSMIFPPDSVPYLGMWINEGGWAGQYNVAPEPATAGMDRVDFSKMWNMADCTGPFSKKSWYLRISVVSGKTIPKLNGGTL